MVWAALCLRLEPSTLSDTAGLSDSVIMSSDQNIAKLKEALGQLSLDATVDAKAKKMVGVSRVQAARGKQVRA